MAGQPPICTQVRATTSDTHVDTAGTGADRETDGEGLGDVDGCGPGSGGPLAGAVLAGGLGVGRRVRIAAGVVDRVTPGRSTMTTCRRGVPGLSAAGTVARADASGVKGDAATGGLLPDDWPPW
jgi:hypothetical protein